MRVIRAWYTAAFGQPTGISAHLPSRLDERFTHSFVSASVAGSDKVGDSARLEEGLEIRAWVELLDKLNKIKALSCNEAFPSLVANPYDLHKTEANESCLRIIPESQAIGEASG